MHAPRFVLLCHHHLHLLQLLRLWRGPEAPSRSRSSPSGGEGGGRQRVEPLEDNMQLGADERLLAQHRVHVATQPRHLISPAPAALGASAAQVLDADAEPIGLGKHLLVGFTTRGSAVTAAAATACRLRMLDLNPHDRCRLALAAALAAAALALLRLGCFGVLDELV